MTYASSTWTLREDDQDSAAKDASLDCTDETKIQTEKSENGLKRRGHRKSGRTRGRRYDRQRDK